MAHRHPLVGRIRLISISILVAVIVCFVSWVSISNETGHLHHKETAQPISKTTTDLFSKDEALDSLAQEAQEHLPVHESASTSSQDTFSRLCKTYSEVCDITRFDGSSFEDKHKLYYQALVIYGIHKLHSMNIPVLDYVDRVTIRSHSAKSRGYSSRNEIVLDTKAMGNFTEFFQVFIHELGHIVDFRYLLGNDGGIIDKDYTEFGRPTFPTDDPSLDFYKLSWINENTTASRVTYKDFVSGYSRKNIFEDMAESMNFYLNHQESFKTLAQNSSILQAKYDFLHYLFGATHINSGKRQLQQFIDNPDFRPYDTTRF